MGFHLFTHALRASSHECGLEQHHRMEILFGAWGVPNKQTQRQRRCVYVVQGRYARSHTQLASLLNGFQSFEWFVDMYCNETVT